MKKPVIVLRNSPIYLFIFLSLAFIFCDITFSLNIIFKTDIVLWYKSFPRIFFAIMLVILGISSLNDFFSRVYLFDDCIMLKTIFRASTLLLEDVVKLKYESSFGMYATLGSFIFCDEKDKELWKLPVSFVKSIKAKQQLINFLISNISKLQVDPQCNRFLNNR